MKRCGWMNGRATLLVAMLMVIAAFLAVPRWAVAVIPPPEDEEPRARDDASDSDPQAHGQRPAELRPRDRFGDEGRRGRRGDRRRGDRSRESSRRGRDGLGRPGDFDRQRDEMSPRMIDRVMNLLREEVPRWHDRLADMEEHRPAQFRRAMRRMQPVVREYTSLRDRNPELAETILEEFRIEGRLRSMGRAFREARGNESRQRQIEQEVSHLVQRQFEMKMHRRVARLQEIERRLMREREKFEREKAALPRRVHERVRQITRGNREGSLHERDGESRRQRRDIIEDKPERRPQRRR